MSDSDIDLRKTLYAGAELAGMRAKRTTAYESHAMNLSNLDDSYAQDSTDLKEKIKTLQANYTALKKGRRAALKLAVENLKKEFEQNSIKEDEQFDNDINEAKLSFEALTEKYKTQRNIIEQNMEAARLSAIKELFEESQTEYESLESDDERQLESIDSLEAILARLARLIEISKRGEEYYSQALALQKKIQPLMAKRIKQISSAYLKTK